MRLSGSESRAFAGYVLAVLNLNSLITSIETSSIVTKYMGHNTRINNENDRVEVG
jgi:hypothetical protein